MSENELKHYGVLGMKWGVRKATRYKDKASTAKRVGDMNKYKKYSAKFEKLTSRHKKLGGSAYDYTNKESFGKTVVKSIVFGDYGGLKYNEARAKGVSRGKAVVKGTIAGILNISSAGLLSYVEPRLR